MNFTDTKKPTSSEQIKQVNWLKLDNAGKIYPAAKRKDWTALFRVSATLLEPIDRNVLIEAQKNTLKRFPGFSVRLRAGLFWYYLETLNGAPAIQEDVANPCVRMNFKENGGFMFRVRYHDRTIALEVFHVLSDGTGGLSFLLTLTAEYLRLKYGAAIPRDQMILNCNDTPLKNEIEDAFIKFAREGGMSRKEKKAFYISGTSERADAIHVIKGISPVELILEKSRKLNVSLTEYLAAAMIVAINNIQTDELLEKKRTERLSLKQRKKLKPVKVGIPVNLRRFYDTNTKRNFASYINVGIEPKMGEYSFEEIAKIVHHQMGLEFTEKQLNAKFSTNVNTEKSIVLSLTPLFLKNIAMRAVFLNVGDKMTSTTLSNLGKVSLPPEMSKFVSGIDFLVGPLSLNRIVCGAVTYNGSISINFIRTMKEPRLEREFFRCLIKLGIPVLVTGNSI